MSSHISGLIDYGVDVPTTVEARTPPTTPPLQTTGCFPSAYPIHPGKKNGSDQRRAAIHQAMSPGHQRKRRKVVEPIPGFCPEAFAK